MPCEQAMADGQLSSSPVQPAPATRATVQENWPCPAQAGRLLVLVVTAGDVPSTVCSVTWAWVRADAVLLGQ